MLWNMTLAVSFSSEMPDLFSNTNHNFEKLSKCNTLESLRVYWTLRRNPLVALYFACAEHPLKAGARCLYPEAG